MSQPPPNEPQLSEEQLRQIEAEMERITVDDVLLQTLVTLLNLAARKAGLASPPGEGPPPDLEQMRQAITILRQELSEASDDDDSVDFAEIRQRLSWMLTALRHQRARESDLIYDAYRDAFDVELERDRP